MYNNPNTQIHKDRFKPIWVFMIIVSIVLICCLSIQAVMGFIKKASMNENTTNNPSEIVEQLGKRNKQMEHARLYSSKFLVLSNKINRANGKILIQGSIINNGTMGINDIEITIYCLSSTTRIMDSIKFVSHSPDGKSLWRYERRNFEHIIEDKIDSLAEIVLHVTDIEFAN